LLLLLLKIKVLIGMRLDLGIGIGGWDHCPGSSGRRVMIHNSFGTEQLFLSLINVTAIRIRSESEWGTAAQYQRGWDLFGIQPKQWEEVTAESDSVARDTNGIGPVKNVLLIFRVTFFYKIWFCRLLIPTNIMFFWFLYCKIIIFYF
jgi:hypothetical protein